MAASAKLVLSLFALALLAGCTSGGEGGDGTGNGGAADPPKVVATSTTGGIRGVVVDDRIVPIKGALVSVENTAKNMTTADDGAFVFSGLEPGTYFVKVTHPFYTSGQVSADVVAGDEDPKAVKVQLLRTVFAEPFAQTMQYEGFIVCSVNLVILLSEECGEGVGVPCDVPVVGCQRHGGQANNNVQFDFTVGANAKTVVVEKVWEPTSDAGTALYSPISTEWSCLPSCSGNQLASMDGESPLYVAFGNDTLEAEDVLPDETVISVFTWASPSHTGATLNQRYTDYVTVFYVLPAPEGWSFVNGDPNPFQ